MEQQSQPVTFSPLNLHGILLPFTTPFTQNEEVDTDSLRWNLGRWNGTGISGYVALGSTGERVHLNETEYLKVVETAREEVPRNLTLIVGVGQQSTRLTIQEVQRVAALGADAVLAITPSFYRPAITQAVLIAHYTAIAEAAPIPVVLYSMPDLTGVVIEPETVATLSSHPNIIGMKDSSSDIARFAKTSEQADAQFKMITGNGTVLLEALIAGARTGILAVGCVAAEQCVEIHRLFLSGQTDLAAQIQTKLTPLALAVTKRYGIGGLKVAMDFAGYKGGPVRAPLRSPSDEATSEIIGLLNSVIGSSGKSENWKAQHPAQELIRS